MHKDSSNKGKAMTKVGNVTFPEYSGLRCLMMPYVQGEPDSVPDVYTAYRDIIRVSYLKRGAVGHLTIDESPVRKGVPHRGARAKFGRALHTEAGRLPCHTDLRWGSWGGHVNVTLDWDVQVLLANNLDTSCALWDAEHPDTSPDGDIGDCADQYPYENAVFSGRAKFTASAS